MKTTTMMIALALSLSAGAYAQQNDQVEPDRSKPQRQVRGGDGERLDHQEYGRSSQGPRRMRDDQMTRPRRDSRQCPTCGERLRNREGQRFGSGGQGEGPRRRWGGMDRSQEWPSVGRWHTGRRGPGPEWGPGSGWRRDAYGGAPGNERRDRTRGPGRGGFDQ